MPHWHRDRLPLAVVNWETITHMVATDTQMSWIEDHYKQTATAWTQCGKSITGFIDDGENHVITCLECIGASVWDPR